MLSQIALEAYRKMTPGERLALSLRASRESIPHLLSGSKEMVDRKFERMREEKAIRNRLILEKLAAAEKRG